MNDTKWVFILTKEISKRTFSQNTIQEWLHWLLKCFKMLLQVLKIESKTQEPLPKDDNGFHLPKPSSNPLLLTDINLCPQESQNKIN